MPSRPSIEVVVSALDGGIDLVRRSVAAEIETGLLVIHQVTDDRFISDADWPDRVDYQVRREVGLARSRNAGLSATQADVVVIADEDSRFLPGAFDSIGAAYERHPDAAAITFRTDADVRWAEDFEHNRYTVGQVYSLLITYRPAWLRAHGVEFDERFGLGSTFPQGEDNILLADIRRAGGLVIGAPERIIPDPGATSGDLFTAERITTKVVVARRMYGWLGGLAVASKFLWTKRRFYRRDGVSTIGYLTAAGRGLLPGVLRSRKTTAT